MTVAGLHILLIEDNEGDARLLRQMFIEAEGIQATITWVQRLDAAVSQLCEQTFDAILTDLDLPDSNGIDTCQALLHHSRRTPLVVLSGLGDNTVAMQAVQMGAQDYLIKGLVDSQVLIRSINYAIERYSAALIIRRLNESLQQQYAITRILSEDESLEVAAPKIIQTIADGLQWDMGELWMVDQEKDRLIPVELWCSPAIPSDELMRLTRSLTFVKGDGFSGRVWANESPLWMADVVKEPGFPPFHIAADAGLHGAFGFPIQLGSEVLGVMTFFSRTIRPPDDGLLRMFASIGAQIGQFIERRQAETALRESEAKLDYLLRRFVPGPVAEQLITYKQNVRLGGERREISVLFADIRGYTALTETLDPPVLMDVLNQHFGLIGRIILKQGGTINQYAGDMIMATFNAPTPQPDHAVRAVRAAVEAQTALQARQTRSTKSLVTARFGIGVHTGMAVVGYVGFEDRFDYATLGETTNIAFRLSSMADPGQILIGSETMLAVRSHFNVQPLGPLNLKGRTKLLMVHVVVG